MRAMACAVAFLLAGVSLTAHAALVRVDFSGVVDEIRGPESALGGSIHVGTPFSGYLTYDDSTLPNDAQLETEFAPAWAIYYFPGVVDGVHGEIGDFVRTTSFGTLMEISDHELFPSADPSHLYLAGGFATSTPPSEMTLIEVILWASGGVPREPLHGVSPAGIPWNLASFPNTEAEWRFFDGATQVTVRGPVTYLVPEPGVAALFALASAALLGLRTRWTRPGVSRKMRLHPLGVRREAHEVRSLPRPASPRR